MAQSKDLSVPGRQKIIMLLLQRKRNISRVKRPRRSHLFLQHPTAETDSSRQTPHGALEQEPPEMGNINYLVHGNVGSNEIEHVDR